MKFYLHIDCKGFGTKMKNLASKRNIKEMQNLFQETREAFDNLAREFPQEVILWGGDEIILQAEEEILQKIIIRFLKISKTNISDFHIRFSEDIAEFYK